MSESNNTKKRREIIRQIIREEQIGTQEQLAGRLREMGFKATQSTVSRDIQDLRLIKITSAGKRYYALPTEKRKLKASDTMIRMYKEAVLSVAQTTNMVIIHTTPGMAQGLCVTMDQLNWEGVLGTLAGDDTVLVIARSETIANEILDALNDL